MPTVRSLFLHLAIAAVATLMVAAAAVAVGLSGAHSMGGRLETSDAVRFASDWPGEPTSKAPSPRRPALDRSTID